MARLQLVKDSAVSSVNAAQKASKLARLVYKDP